MLTDRFKRGLIKFDMDQILIVSLGWLARCGISHRGHDKIYNYYFTNWKMKVELGSTTFFNSTHFITVAPFFGTIVQRKPVYDQIMIDDPGLYRVLKLLRD